VVSTGAWNFGATIQTRDHFFVNDLDFGFWYFTILIDCGAFNPLVSITHSGLFVLSLRY